MKDRKKKPPVSIMRTKISKVASDLNVGMNTVVEFLRKNHIEVDSNPNARIDENAVELLRKEFSQDKAVKAKVEGKINERRSDRVERAERRQQAVEMQTPQLKVVGKINLDEPRRPKTKEEKPVKKADKPISTPEVKKETVSPQIKQEAPKVEKPVVEPKAEPKPEQKQ